MSLQRIARAALLVALFVSKRILICAKYTAGRENYAQRNPDGKTAAAVNAIA